MKEDEFNRRVSKTINRWIQDYLKSLDTDFEAEDIELHSKYRLTIGSVPQYKEKGVWHTYTFSREIDIVIGRNVLLDNSETKSVIPLYCIELKTSDNLNTDELDKKGAIYGSIKERYPLVKTAFLYKDNKRRSMRDNTFLRNARAFDYVFTEWEEDSRNLLKGSILLQLKYCLEYWGR